MRLRVLRQCAAIILLVVDAEIVSASGGHKSKRHLGCSSEFQFAEPSLSGGRKLTYRLKATNRDRLRTTSYQGQADGVVKKDSAGKFVQEYASSNLISDTAAVSLSPAAACFPQILSLEQNYRPSVPDLSQAIPLVGPI